MNEKQRKIEAFKVAVQITEAAVRGGYKSATPSDLLVSLYNTSLKLMEGLESKDND